MRGQIITEIAPMPLGKHWRFIDMSDKIIGRLKVIAHAGRGKWFCQCECGNKIIVTGGHLRDGSTSSCGCLHTDNTKQANTKHGESNRSIITTEYIVYCSARDRCNNVNHKYFKDYGGRGIQFKFNSYEQFLNEVGRKPTPKHTLDRIDNNGNYQIGNIRWATRTQQARNRRNNRIITIDGIEKCQSEWSEIYGISTKRIDARRRRNWCDKCAVSLPIGIICFHKN